MTLDDHDLDRWLQTARRNFVTSVAEELDLDSILEQIRARVMPPIVTRGTVSAADVNLADVGSREATPPVASPPGVAPSPVKPPGVTPQTPVRHTEPPDVEPGQGRRISGI